MMRMVNLSDNQRLGELKNKDNQIQQACYQSNIGNKFLIRLCNAIQNLFCQKTNLKSMVQVNIKLIINMSNHQKTIEIKFKQAQRHHPFSLASSFLLNPIPSTSTLNFQNDYALPIISDINHSNISYKLNLNNLSNSYLQEITDITHKVNQESDFLAYSQSKITQSFTMDSHLIRIVSILNKKNLINHFTNFFSRHPNFCCHTLIESLAESFQVYIESAAVLNRYLSEQDQSLYHKRQSQLSMESQKCIKLQKQNIILSKEMKKILQKSKVQQNQFKNLNQSLSKQFQKMFHNFNQFQSMIYNKLSALQSSVLKISTYRNDLARIKATQNQRTNEINKFQNKIQQLNQNLLNKTLDAQKLQKIILTFKQQLISKEALTNFHRISSYGQSECQKTANRLKTDENQHLHQKIAKLRKQLNQIRQLYQHLLHKNIVLQKQNYALQSKTKQDCNNSLSIIEGQHQDQQLTYIHNILIEDQ